MKLYRIVQDKERTSDLSGTGSFRFGGRWNSKGTYMLYTSETSSLAYLENLVHFDKILIPPQLYIVQIELNDASPVYRLPDVKYKENWRKLSFFENQALGDRWMDEKKYIAIKVKSAINPIENNYLLNPLFPKFNDLVKIVSVTQIDVDHRLA